MKQAGRIYFAIFAFFIFACAANVYAAATGPTVDKASIIMSVMQRGDKWLPKLSFKVNGPIAAGTSFIVNYALASGKPWVTLNLTSEEQCATCWYQYKDIGVGSGLDIPDEKATAETGKFGLKISVSNELEGTKGVLYDGSFVVKKFKASNGEVNHYVDQDWRLPIGYIWGDWYEQNYGAWTENKAPGLYAAFWFRGQDVETQAFVYYQGKKIASASPGGKGCVTTSVSTWVTSENNWYCYSYSFTEGTWVKWWLMPEVAQNFEGAHVLYSNPGEYEIKVLRGGKLSRVAKFTIGSDGKFSDNGFAMQIAHFDQWIIPAQVAGDGDGKWDSELYKTGAFYGNPLTGFTVP